MKGADIEPFFAPLQAANPMPASEVDYSSVFERLAPVLLVACTPQAILAEGIERAELMPSRRLHYTAATQENKHLKPTRRLAALAGNATARCWNGAP